MCYVIGRGVHFVVWETIDPSDLIILYKVSHMCLLFRFEDHFIAKWFKFSNFFILWNKFVGAVYCSSQKLSHHLKFFFWIVWENKVSSLTTLFILRGSNVFQLWMQNSFISVAWVAKAWQISSEERWGNDHEQPPVTLCSRNFQNVKLRLDFVEIW